MTLVPGKNPTTDVELVRSFHDRLRRLENPQTLRVGPWVLSSQSGRLTAQRPGLPAALFLDEIVQPQTRQFGSSRGYVVPGGGLTAGEVTEAITGTPGDLEDIGAWLDAQWQKFLTPQSPINADNLFGWLPPWLLGKVPVSLLTNEPVQQLFNPNFTGEVSLNDPSGRWTWDHTVYRSTDDPEPELRGSATVELDGTRLELESNPIPAIPGKTVSVQAHLASLNMTGTGQVAQVVIQPYTKVMVDGLPTRVEGEQSVIAYRTGPPSALATDWAAKPAGARSATLSGGWLTPQTGVDEYTIRLVITAAATGGRIWWDDILQAPADKIPQLWVENLNTDLNQQLDKINAVFQAFTTAGTPEAFTNAVNGLLALLGIGDKDDIIDPNTPATWTTIWNDILDPLGLIASQPDLNSTNSVINQISDIFNDLIVTPINTAVQQVSDWWNSIWKPFKTTTPQVAQATLAAVKFGADGADVEGEVTPQQAQDSVANLRTKMGDLQQQVDGLTTTNRPGGKLYRAQGLAVANNWSPFVISGNTAAAKRDVNGFGWAKSGTASRTVWGLYPDALNTDAQMAEITLRTAISFDYFGDTFDKSGSNMVFIRGNDNLTDMVYVRAYGAGWRIYGRYQGVDTKLYEGTMSGAGAAGTKWSIYCLGTTYTVFKDGALVKQFTYTGVTAGSTHRRTGIGAGSAANSLGEWPPGQVVLWMARDAAPVLVKGSGAYINGAGDGSTMPRGTVPVSSVSTLDRKLFAVTAEVQSDDIALVAYNTTPGVSMGFQVTDESWYYVEAGLYGNNAANINDYSLASILQTDGDHTNPRWFYGDWTQYRALYNTNGQVVGSAAPAYCGRLVYAAAGDLFQPAGMFGHTNTVMTAVQGYVYMSIARVGAIV